MQDDQPEEPSSPSSVCSQTSILSRESVHAGSLELPPQKGQSHDRLSPLSRTSASGGKGKRKGSHRKKTASERDEAQQRSLEFVQQQVRMSSGPPRSFVIVYAAFSIERALVAVEERSAI